MPDHTYRAQLQWSGSTGAGYRAYPRAHSAVAPPAADVVELSADPHFRGDSDLMNPEQLVVMAASSCQLLSFLAVAARAGVDVVGYEDDAVGVMPADVSPQRITRIELRPRITVTAQAGPDPAGVVAPLVHQAHDECYVANSLTAEVRVDPTVVVGG
ncbi:MAG TPA: OsmC family protein [Pedococcus sp.]|jgi:organic hydroperoxide reductase OsmC/OhrA|uniref:OsmC family protein n=1 Tax=Pedococcus sp. TaxID=2860345 RepID=UPI002F936DC5